MRAAGYIRVSTEEQVKHGWNLGADRERIERICQDRSWELVEVFDDGGLQGDDPDRPGFNRMLDSLDSFDVIVMRSLDRLSRDTFLYALATKAIRDAGVQVESFRGPVDLETPEGELSANVLAAIARFEKRQIAVRVRQAKEARAKAGLHPGGKRPYGYRYGDGDVLVVDPVEAAVVRRMFQMAEATSQRKIARILNDEGIPSSKGGRWAQSVVARVLGSPLYIGKIRRKVGGEWEWYQGEHEAIVDEDLWHRVNRSRSTPERRAGGRPLATGHLLTRGLLRCGQCASAMIPVGSYNGRPETYKCIGRRDHGPEFCRQPSVRRVLIDEALLGELTTRYLDLDCARDRLREQQATELPNAQHAVEAAEREASKAAEAVARVKRDYTSGEITAAEWRELRADLEAELAGAQEAVEQARSRVEQITEAGTATDAEEALLAQLADLKALVSGTVEGARDVESLRTVIRQLFERIILRAWSWEHLPEIEAAGVGVGEGLFVVPVLRKGVADWSSLPPTINRVPVPEDLTLPTCR